MRLRAAVVVAVLLAAACGGDGMDRTPTVPNPPPLGPTPLRSRLLVVTHTEGFRHDSIPTAEAAVLQMATTTGAFDVEFCRTRDDVRRMLTPAGLSPFAAVAFINTTGNLGIPVAALLDWVRAGHGFIGAHSASDTYHDEPGYLAMLGGEFETHSRADRTAQISVRASQPAVAHLGASFEIMDEFYRFKGFDPSAVTVVLAFDRVPDDGVGDAGSPADLPLAWHRTFGTGLVFHTALGHRSEMWTDDSRFTQHILGAIRWALGQ